MLMQTTVIPNQRFKLLSIEPVDITKQLAVEFSTQLDVNLTERKIKNHRMKEIKDRYERGLLTAFRWITVRVAQLGNKQLRINGQHTSTFLASLPEPFPVGLKATIERYEVDSQEDAVLLFRQIDAMMSARTPEEVAYVYQRQHPELRDVNNDSERRACIGIIYYRWKIHKPAPVSPEPKNDDRFEIVNEGAGLRSFIVWVCGLMEGDKSYLAGKNGKPAIAAMFNTFEKNEAMARKFWGQVARQGDPYNHEDPTSALYLGLKKVLRDKEYKKALNVTEKSIYWGCVFAWNAFREEKEIREMRWDVIRDAIE